jgi:hypothetical protein
VQRAGARRRPVRFLAFICALLVASCYSSNYRREMLASTALVASLSDKLIDYCRADFIVDRHPLSSEEMGEFYYGLKKARAFQQMTAKREDSEASAQAFGQLVEAYENFVRDADQYRLNPAHTPEQLEQLLKDHDLVKQRAEAVKRALDTETWPAQT